MSAIPASGILKTCNTRNTKISTVLCFFGIMLGAFVFFLDVPAFAETSQTTTTKLNDEISLEKTVTTMSIPENNTLPWGTVKGKVNDPSQGYPVIIQFFKSLDEDPIHVAQVSLKGDDSFEYKFRVLSIDDGGITNFFKGDYYVKIFKVVNTPRGDLDSA